MIILGVAFLADASACVIKDGELLSAVSEERLNRIKLWHGVPHKAIKKALMLAGITMGEVDLIATHGKAPSKPDIEPFKEIKERIKFSNISNDLKEVQIDAINNRYKHECDVLGKRTPKMLDELKSYGKPLSVFSHHESHAASAYFGSGWSSCYILTADGWGEDASSTVWYAHDGKLDKKGFTNSFDSLGYFYGSITKALGFTPHRHEGKVLGLAAYSKGNEDIYSIVRDMIAYDHDILGFRGLMENGIYKPHYNNPELSEKIKKYSREDVSSAVQSRLEEVVCQLVSDLHGKNLKIGLAGGIFANVKLNQRILEMENVDDIFIFPNMGDGGLSVGAAYLAYHEQTNKMPAPFTNAFLGTSPTNDDILSELNKSNLEYEYKSDIGKEVATLLASDNVVVRVNGKMEFGPRALGNRSILYKCTEPDVNQWLNTKLNRSEFMPFAPMTLSEYANKYYINLSDNNRAAKYMTVTVDCTDLMCKESPAAVHVDRTARPQIITEDDYPDIHKILDEYRKLTGFCSIINTSFNMHEEPIVCTATDAIRAFKDSDLPWMALGNYLVKGVAANANN